jgi:hypothetical protein
MQHESKKEKAKKLSTPYRAGEANGLTASNKVRPPVPKQGKSNVRRRQKHTYTDNPVLPSILAPPLRCPKNPKQKHTDEKSNKPKRLSSTSPPPRHRHLLPEHMAGRRLSSPVPCHGRSHYPLSRRFGSQSLVPRARSPLPIPF